MFPSAPAEVVCYADVQRAVGAVRHNIYPPKASKKSPVRDVQTATWVRARRRGWPDQVGARPATNENNGRHELKRAARRTAGVRIIRSALPPSLLRSLAESAAHLLSV